MGVSKVFNYTTDQVLEAIKGSGSIITTIARRLDCAWSTAQKYCMMNEDTKKALADEGEKILDLAESVLFESIKKGDTQNAKWLLSTKGRKRGYSDKDQLTPEDTNILSEQIKKALGTFNENA